MYPEFQYFLEAYCTLGLEKKEILETIEQFKGKETQRVQKECKEELQRILNSNHVVVAREMIQEYGYRILSIEETEKWLRELIKAL